MKNPLERYWIKAHAEVSSEDFSEGGDDGLTILRDEKSHRFANKIFKQFCSDGDYSRFPAFLQEFDDLLAKYCTKEGEEGTEDPSEDDSEVERTVLDDDEE
jgi:hypothetical protein